MSDIKRKINSDLDDRMTLDWQGTRAFFYGLGYNDADIEKPRTRRSFRCLLRGGGCFVRDLFLHMLVGTVGKVHK